MRHFFVRGEGSQRILPVMSLILVSAFWGIHAVVGKAVEAQLNPFALTVWRFTLGAVFYAPLLARISRLPRRTWRQLAVTGLFWAVIYPLFYYQSLRFITPVESLLLINTSPLIAAFFGWLALKEPIRLTQAIGIGIAFLGVGMTAFGQRNAHTSIIGIVFVLVAATSFAAYTVSSRSLAKQLPLLEMVAATSVSGAIELWIMTIFSGQASAVWHALTRLNVSGWEGFLYVVVMVSTVAYILYGYGLKRLPSSVSSALTFYPQVLFAALAQWLWFGIQPTLTLVFSAILILGGVVIMQWPARQSDFASSSSS